MTEQIDEDKVFCEGHCARCQEWPRCHGKGLTVICWDCCEKCPREKSCKDRESAKKSGYANE